MMNLFRSIPIFLCLCLAVMASGCGGMRSGGQGTRYPYAGASDREVCADLVTYPQDLSVYAAHAPEGGLLAFARQQEEVEKQKKWFFAPWQMTRSGFSAKEALWAMTAMRPQTGFAENLRPYTEVEWQQLLANCNTKTFPSLAKTGITVRNTGQRAMPTARPYFKNPDDAGEGYPFDYFLNSALWAGTPLFISHLSQDGLWAFTETRASSGWVPVQDIAFVDPAFAHEWQQLPLAAIVKDHVIVGDAATADAVSGGKSSVIQVHIGTLLPLLSTSGQTLTVLYPSRMKNGFASMTEATLASEQAVRVPLPLTAKNVAEIGNVMMGQPYGWAGYGENRDCSAMLRDLFTPFGLWLPRNSAQQGAWGTPVDLQGLSAHQKEEQIKKRATPFLSLLWLRGHITLYVGEHQGKAMMFHDAWGVRVNGKGYPMRAVIGKVAVTTLRPGVELPNISSPASLLDRIERISTVE